MILTQCSLIFFDYLLEKGKLWKAMEVQATLPDAQVVLLCYLAGQDQHNSFLHQPNFIKTLTFSKLSFVSTLDKIGFLIVVPAGRSLELLSIYYNLWILCFTACKLDIELNTEAEHRVWKCSIPVGEPENG